MYKRQDEKEESKGDGEGVIQKNGGKVKMEFGFED